MTCLLPRDGTEQKNADSIICDGFLSSKGKRFRFGLYITPSIEVATNRDLYSGMENCFRLGLVLAP